VGARVEREAMGGWGVGRACRDDEGDYIFGGDWMGTARR